jgi:membrane associated rhomboid family serine protease
VFLPLGHENMQSRRWPIITIGLIALNIVAFLGTHWTMEQQDPQVAAVRAHVLMLAAMHPEVTLPDNVKDFVETYKQKHPGIWKQVANPNREVEDAWDAKMRLMEEPQQFQREMDSLALQFQNEAEASVVGQYAFTPAHPQAISFLSANFLHAGWLHLIGNMWFLWLAGLILEDTWGRAVYIIFYLVAGAFALEVHAFANPDSMVPTIGASGAVAALMGAFLVRFPKTKVQMLWMGGLLRFYRAKKFTAYAYWLLPIWLLMEVFSGALFGQGSSVAHWAHVGGFVFGMCVAVGLRYSGLEQRTTEAVEAADSSWKADPGIEQAAEFMEQGKLDDALSALQSTIAAKPDSLDAYTLLQQIYWRKNNLPAYHDAMVKVCQLQIKAQEPELAWSSYGEYTNSGGDAMPAATLLELCRIAENRQEFSTAVAEYEKLAAKYPSERPGLLALIAAGRISLKKLNRPNDALKFYKGAASSSVPHLDWEANIQNGIQEATKALSGEPIPQLQTR